MAALTAVKAKHATLSTTTADSITLSGRGEWVNIINHSLSERLTVTFGAAAAPTASMDDAYVIPAGGSALFPYPGNASLVVRVVGNGNAYSVQLI
jgi:hypothetical protein